MEEILQRQQFASPVVDKRLKSLQPPCREIIIAMPFKTEFSKGIEMFPLPIGHESRD